MPMSFRRGARRRLSKRPAERAATLLTLVLLFACTALLYTNKSLIRLYTFTGFEVVYLGAVFQIDANMSKSHSRVLFYDGVSFTAVNGRTVSPLSKNVVGSLQTRDPPSLHPLPNNTTNCVPIKSWQIRSFPTCNSMHEISLSNEHENGVLRLVGTGRFRAAWKIRNSQGDIVIYKTLKWKGRKFDKATENLHRVDAVTTERLTSSKYVIDIYSYCGQSVMNEYADQERLTSFIKDKFKSGPDKLKLARDVAQSIADLHNADKDGNVTIVHQDIKPDNIVIVNGRPKLNDFNKAEFLRWDIQAHRQCNFQTRRRTPTFMAPEEVLQKLEKVDGLISEKSDIFALGGLFYFIMTGGHKPYTIEQISQEEQFRQISTGIKAKIPHEIEISEDPATVSLRDAFLKCQELEAGKRPTAREVANDLSAALASLTTRGNKTMTFI